MWETVLAATIWTIWLIRNESSFHSKEPVISNVMQLIKFKSLSWGLALGLIIKKKSSWWADNPTGVVTASLKAKWFDILLEENCSIAAFVDESWKRVGHYIRGGIGGLAKSLKGDHILEFDGPVIAHSALQIERQALIQLVALLENSQRSSEKILILTDSNQLIESVKIQQLSSEWDRLKTRISIRHVNRVFNTQADSLAKHEACLNKLWTRWPFYQSF